MEKTNHFYRECVDNFDNIIKKPSQFLQIDENLCSSIRENLKTIYDFTKREETKSIDPVALPELVVENFDLEQIWQQLELQNESVISHSLKKATKLVIGKSRLLFENFEKEIGNAEKTEEHKGDEISTKEILQEEQDKVQSSDVERESERSTNERPKKNLRKSIVDDDFFKLQEMEEFLNDEEKKFNELDSGNDSEELEEECEDLFMADSNDDSDDGRVAKYRDFFVSKEKNQEENEEPKPKSSFESRQSRLIEKIAEIEEEAVQEKSWQLKGEITAEKRPQNSLLEEIVEFDMTTRPSPVITEQTTLQLEDIIKQRIRERVFDSVERKAKPVETSLEYKKKLVLDQEKSKESLAQIYEREFIEQRAALNCENQEKEEKKPESHREIDEMMKGLFFKLDALSNFHFTPKPAVPDLKIVNNLPAVSMEEVAPIAMSDAALLAPEEVKAKTRSDILGAGERTATDKKRERRKKKRKQRIHVLEKRKRENTSRSKRDKDAAMRTLEKVVKGNNTDKMDVSFDGGKVKSSKAFFAQLQEQIHVHTTRTRSDNTGNRKKTQLNAKKIKL